MLLTPVTTSEILGPGSLGFPLPNNLFIFLFEEIYFTQFGQKIKVNFNLQ